MPGPRTQPGGPPVFARARTPEQKEQRREAILAAAATLVAARGVRDLTLADLADEVGLATSNVVRHFGTREEIFVELVARESRAVTREVVAALDALPRAGGTAVSDDVAAVIVRAVRAHPVFCELAGHVPTHLEHNVSLDTAVSLKEGMATSVADLAGALRRACPALGADQAGLYVVATMTLVSSAWANARPAPVVRRVYERRPDLAPVGDLVGLLEPVLAATLRGFLVAGEEGQRTTGPVA